MGALIVDAPAIWLLHQLGFHELALDTTRVAFVYAIAGFCWLFVILVWMVAWSAIHARGRVAQRGYWAGNKFVFREPQVITTILADASNRGRKAVINIDAVPKFAVVYCQIIEPTNSSRIQAILQGPFSSINNWRFFVQNMTWPTFETGPLYVAVRIGNKKELYLEWWMEDNVLPHHLRVEMLSYEMHFLLKVSQPTNGYAAAR